MRFELVLNDDQKVPVLFNMGTFKFMAELSSGEPFDIDTLLTSPGEQFRALRILLHAGMLNAAFVDKRNFDFTVEDIERLVADLDFDDANTLTGLWQKATAAKSSEDNAAKKKRIILQSVLPG